MSQNLSWSSFSSTTSRVDCELNEEGTSLRAVRTISSILVSAIGLCLFRA